MLFVLRWRAPENRGAAELAKESDLDWLILHNELSHWLFLKELHASHITAGDALLLVAQQTCAVSRIFKTANQSRADPMAVCG